VPECFGKQVAAVDLGLQTRKHDSILKGDTDQPWFLDDQCWQDHQVTPSSTEVHDGFQQQKQQSPFMSSTPQGGHNYLLIISDKFYLLERQVGLTYLSSKTLKQTLIDRLVIIIWVTHFHYSHYCRKEARYMSTQGLSWGPLSQILPLV